MNKNLYLETKIATLRSARNTINSSTFEEQYVESLMNIQLNGTKSLDRTGVGTTKVIGQSFRINLDKTPVPILSGKKMNFKSALTEIIWIMKGETNIDFLKKHGVNYWDEWADENGNLGKIYGHQMRQFDDRFDQLNDVIQTLIDNPYSRRILISLWNPNQYNEQSLIPCHGLYHFNTYVKNDETVMDLVVYQRSADSFLGIGYDFMLFSLLLQFVGHFTHIKPGIVHVHCGDYHIYDNHHEQVEKYISNCLEDEKGIFDQYQKDNIYPSFANLGTWLPTYKEESFETFMKCLEDNLDNINDSLKNYNHYPFIKAQVAV